MSVLVSKIIKVMISISKTLTNDEFIEIRPKLGPTTGHNGSRTINAETMTRRNPSHLDDKAQEQIEISFLVFRFKCSSPTFKTVIILSIVLIFLLIVVHCLPKISLLKQLTG